MSKKFIYDNNGIFGEADSFEKSDYISISNGISDAGKPIILDATGKIDSSMIDDGRAKNVSIDELTITQINTKVSYPLVNGLKKLVIRNKSMAETKFNFDNGLKNFTIPKGTCFELNDLNFVDKILYIEVDKESTLEIIQLY